MFLLGICHNGNIRSIIHHVLFVQSLREHLKTLLGLFLEILIQNNWGEPWESENLNAFQVILIGSK